MQFISFIVPLIITIIGSLIPISSLNTKTKLGRTFLTDEQKIKVKYFNNIMFSLMISLGIALFYLSAHLNISGSITSEVLIYSLVVTIIAFVFILLITSPLIRLVDNLFIKYHVKYKFAPSDNIGELYIIRMHNMNTCICSPNYNAEYIHNAEYILISMEQVVGKKLLEEKVPKPSRSVLSKLLDL